MNHNQQVEFRSSDIALCAFLLTKKHRLLRIDMNGHQGFFIFHEAEIADDQIRYLNGEGLVEPGAYNLSIRKLKATLNQALRN